MKDVNLSSSKADRRMRIRRERTFTVVPSPTPGRGRIDVKSTFLIEDVETSGDKPSFDDRIHGK